MAMATIDEHARLGAATRSVDVDSPARLRILELVAADGPVSAATLASHLGVTPTAVRRHLAQLEDDGLVAVHEPAPATRLRGRPARLYVATPRGQGELSGAYSDVALQALRLLRETAGEEAVELFAQRRVAELAARCAERLNTEDFAARVTQLAQALSDEGFAASIRPVGGTATVQLCQGHCPVLRIAAEFPQLCEAEQVAFAHLLGSHVQRLATMAAGGHACTTSIPVPVARTRGEPAAAAAEPTDPSHDHGQGLT